MWTKSACVMAACILLILAAASMTRSALLAQAVNRTPRTSSNSTTTSGSTTNSSPAGSIRVTLTTALRPAAPPSGRYEIQPGNTLSGIAAALAVPGGWPALYAANRKAIGPDPGLIHVGTILRVPGAAPARYTVGAGDTLSGIAAALAVPGDWPALYAANRKAIGPDPGLIRTGIVLTIAHPAAPARPRVRPGRARNPHQPAPRPAPRPGSRHRPAAKTRAPAPASMPGWLKLLLLATALLIISALLAGPALAAARRRQPDREPAATLEPAAPAGPATPARPTAPATLTVVGQHHHSPPAPLPVAAAPTTATPAAPAALADTGRPSGTPPPGKARIVLADHTRLVVTHNTADNTVCVLRPPGADPAAILRLARLVVGEGPYRDLVEHLGLPPGWPIIQADYPRLVVTRRTADDTVYILRPPGEDPRAVLRAARLILPEDHYEELAAQLGITPNWPLE